jgi:hypothetical protein
MSVRHNAFDRGFLVFWILLAALFIAIPLTALIMSA